MTNEAQSNKDNSKTSKVLDDIGDNSKAIAYTEIASVMTDILHSPNEDGKRQVNFTLAMFKLPEIFSYNAVSNVFALTKEAKTEARNKLTFGLCNEYTAMIDEQKAYNALKGKKTEEQKAAYELRKLSLNAMDRMVTLALTGIYFLRHPETPKVVKLESVATKGKRTELKVTYSMGVTKGDDGNDIAMVETKQINSAELTRLGKSKLPTVKRNTGDKADKSAIEQKPIADSLTPVTTFLGTEAAKLSTDKGLEDMPESVKLTVRDILKTYLPLEFADRTAKTFDGNAFAKYVTETLKLTFEYQTQAKAKTNGKKAA
jgi:hypothetical protein